MDGYLKHLELLKNERKIIHCITNSVSINDVANVILAVGASPVMADSSMESAEVTKIAGALLLNLGMPSEDKVKAMINSGKEAKRKGIPVVFDPVGAGISDFRNKSALKILSEVKPDIIRGNLAEVEFLVYGRLNQGGVDYKYSPEDSIKKAEDTAREASEKFSAITVITGNKDIVCDGNSVSVISGGSYMLKYVTGTGDMLDGIIASFASVSENRSEAVTEAVRLMGVLGERAQKKTEETGSGIGSFKVNLLDEIWKLKNK